MHRVGYAFPVLAVSLGLMGCGAEPEPKLTPDLKNQQMELSAKEEAAAKALMIEKKEKKGGP